MTEAVQYTIPKEPGRWRSLLLAALVHVMLVGFLWFGVSWQNENTVAVEAEVWDVQVKEAAPAAPPPKPEPRVIEPKPEPVVEPPKPEPKIVQPPPKVVEAPRVITPPVPKPDIALEQEKKRQEAEKRAELERQQKLAEQKLAEQKRQEKKLAEQKQQEKLAEQKRLEEQKRQRAEAEAKRRKEEEQRKLAAEKKRKEEAEAQAAEARHQENLKRLQAQAGGTGEAAKAQGPRSADPSYAQRVGAKIKSHTTFNVLPGLAGNPAVEYDVQLLPDGSVRGIRKLRSSGVAGFDEAVARAIERSQPFPPDQRTGAVPGGFTVTHRPKDQ